MKVVIVVDKELPAGLLANAAAALAFSVSPSINGGVGADLEDAEGSRHPGITSIPLPVLGCGGSQLTELRDRARVIPEVTCVDFSNVAQKAKRYDEYAAALKAASPSQLKYLGLCIFGEPTAVKRLTGHLPLVK
jgi:hypothetical protein